jgi:hypothetical protein
MTTHYTCQVLDGGGEWRWDKDKYNNASMCIIADVLWTSSLSLSLWLSGLCSWFVEQNPSSNQHTQITKDQNVKVIFFYFVCLFNAIFFVYGSLSLQFRIKIGPKDIGSDHTSSGSLAKWIINSFHINCSSTLSFIFYPFSPTS